MNAPAHIDERVRVLTGNCVEIAAQLSAEGTLVDLIACDPPYHLTSIVKRFGAKDSAPAKDRDGLYARQSKGFMGQTWDGGDVAFRAETWAALGAVLKPGGYLLAFSGTRTYHRMACAIEDAGFDVRDLLAWLYGTGFPKSDDIERAVARHLCREPGRHYERTLPPPAKRREGDHICASVPESLEWEGWGTALKPALEPICFARKPLIGTSAENVLVHRTGGLHISACRVAVSGVDGRDVGRQINRAARERDDGWGMNRNGAEVSVPVVRPEGRWPANVAHDSSDEVIAAFPDSAGQESPVTGNEPSRDVFSGAVKFGGGLHRIGGYEPRADRGSAARFFFSAKANADDRMGSDHPTVKPLDLMRWLIRLTVPRGALVLDPFAGTGTTGIAALAEGCRAILIEREPHYVADIHARLAHANGEGPHSKTLKARSRAPQPAGPLFESGIGQ